MDKAVALFQKLAQIDDRPEAGIWEKNLAAARASRANRPEGQPWYNLDPEYSSRSRRYMLADGLKGAGIGALAGGILGASLSKNRKLEAALFTGANLALWGAMIGEIHGADKASKEHYGNLGIKVSKGGFGIELSEEAARNYLSNKYRGGGYTGEQE